MNIDLINLVRLQKLDRRLDVLKKVQQECPVKIAQIVADLKAAEDKLEASLALQKEMLKRRLNLEAEVEDTDQKVKANLARQYQVKTNEEYRALLKENDYLRQSNSKREDEALQLMDDLEKLTAENTGLKIWLAEQRILLVDRKKEIETELETCLQNQEEMIIERNDLIKDIPANTIALYQRVYEKRGGRAVVAIIDGICQDCHLQIPPQDYNELQRNDKVMVCPNCQRIVYWGDHADFAEL